MAEKFRLEDLTPEQRAAAERMMYGGKPKAQTPAPQAAPAPVQAQPPTADIPKVKRNIKRLVEQNAPEEDIDAYVASEGVTFEQLKAHKSQPGELSWSEVPGKALGNLGNSAANLAGAIVHPFLHPVDTAQALGNMAYGAGSKVAGAVGVEQDPERKAANEAQLDAVGKFFADRYGSVDGFKRTLAEDPLGVAADLSIVLSGGGAAAARVPGIVGKAGQVVAKAGSAIDPIANAGRAVAGAGKGTAAVLGMTTGAGSMPVEQAFKAGRAGNKVFVENMRGQAPASDTLDMAKSAMSELRSDRSKAYEAGMQSTKADNSFIDFAPVAKAIADGKAKAYFEGVPKSAAAAQTAKELEDLLSQWRQIQSPNANKAAGLDALKQAIGEVRQSTQPGTLSRNIADQVYNSIKGEIVSQVPEYAQAMKGYSQASDEIDDLTKTFSLGDRAAKDTAIRSLTSVTRNNVNTNYGRRTQLMGELAKKQPDLPNAIAGQALNTLSPRGLQGQMTASGAGIAALAANPLAAALLPATSPRLVGEAAYGAGRATSLIDPALLARVLRGSYIASQASQPLVGSQTGDYPTQ